MGSNYTFTIDIEGLGASNQVSINLSESATWVLGFEIQPEQGQTGPLSIQDLNLSNGALTITAGSAPLNAQLFVNVAIPSGTYLGGTTTSNDPNCHVKAILGPGNTTDIMGKWTVNFG